MSEGIEAMAQEVHELNTQVLQLVRKASTPDAALNALLTAYVNLAAQLGVLEQVPGAGLALGETARTLIALRASVKTPQSPSIH